MLLVLFILYISFAIIYYIVLITTYTDNHKLKHLKTIKDFKISVIPGGYFYLGFKSAYNALKDQVISIIKYYHHDRYVYVREDLKGKHRDFCLCMKCKRLQPGKQNNCEIAQSVFDNCVKFNIVTPMWECPFFEEKK